DGEFKKRNFHIISDHTKWSVANQPGRLLMGKYGSGDFDNKIRLRGYQSGYVDTYYSAFDDWGIRGADSAGNTVFHLGSSNKIAGFNFNTTEFQSSNNTGFKTSGIYMDSAAEQFSLGDRFYYQEGAVSRLA